MSMFRMVFLGALVFIGAVALFLGGVVILTSWQNGAITLSYSDGGRTVVETIGRAADGDRFWRLISTMGLLPAALGAGAMWFGLRALRRAH